MHEPTAKQTLSNETAFFQNTGRAVVFYIAYRPDAEQRRLLQSPAHDFGQDFRRQSLPLPLRRQHISAIEAVWSALAQRERASDAVVLAAHDHVGALDLRRGGDASLNVRSGIVGAAMRSPDQIADDIFILSIGAEDCIGIYGADWP